MAAATKCKAITENPSFIKLGVQAMCGCSCPVVTKATSNTTAATGDLTVVFDAATATGNLTHTHYIIRQTHA